MVCRLKSPRHLTWVPIASGISVARAISDLVPEAPKALVKWPNDVWIESGKVAGLLCEGVSLGDKPALVIGIGVNCAQSPKIPNQATAALANWSHLPARELADLLREKILARLADDLTQLDNEGSDRTQLDYEALAVLRPGTSIRFTRPGPVGTAVGKILGIGPQGELKVVKPDGEILSLFAEDVSIKL